MVKCGIIGCGVISGTHLAGYQRIPEAKVTCFCDLIPERAEQKAAEVPGARWFTDYRQMLREADLDAVSVCTDHASHGQIVCDALNAKKHVICEKVLGRTGDDLDKMLRTAAANPELVASGIFQHRFNPSNAVLRDLVRQQKFGKLLTVSLNCTCLRTREYYEKDAWRGTVAGEGGGVLINQAIHFLDQLRFLFGNVKRVAAISGNLGHRGIIEVEDTISILAEFADGLFVTIGTTNAAFVKWRTALSIAGSDVQIEFIDEKITFLDGKDQNLVSEIRTAIEGAADDGVVHGKSYYGTGHTAQLADFVRAIETHGKPSVSLADAASSAAFVHAAYEAAASGNWVDVRNF